jgi:hypothetical protein
MTLGLSGRAVKRARQAALTRSKPRGRRSSVESSDGAMILKLLTTQWNRDVWTSRRDKGY